MGIAVIANDNTIAAAKAGTPLRMAVNGMPSGRFKAVDFGAAMAFMAAFPVRTVPGEDRRPITPIYRLRPGEA